MRKSGIFLFCYLAFMSVAVAWCIFLLTTGLLLLPFVASILTGIAVILYSTKYIFHCPATALEITALYLADSVFDLGNNLDRKLCELQNPESEIVLQESKPHAP